ncbi:MAG: hypothetical protein FD137_84 [Spirochaetes bacterium]|nr:MAG: hypothetical protein FD137_84 [Spirochaetota bacterium]
MSVKTIVGFVLLAVGVISFVYGLNASKSFALSVFGLIMLVFGFRGSRG